MDADQSSSLGVTRVTARALLLGDRIDTAGLERSDMISATPLAFLAGANGFVAPVLSGAAVKAGVIGLIRFLPFETAYPGWGDALVSIGFMSAFYGVAIGIMQRDPKAVLAYSSISQMGVSLAYWAWALPSVIRGRYWIQPSMRRIMSC